MTGGWKAWKDAGAPTESDIASTLHQLAMLAEEEGNRQEAVRLMREALGIFEKLRSPYVKNAREDLKRLESEAS
jgi:3-mercaptopyruvate sulfurtransferase SseA